MQKISDEIIDEIIKLLDEEKGKLWDSYYWELQEGGVNLLVSVNMVKTPSAEKLKEIKSQITNILSPRLPKDQEFLSWIANIYKENDLVDSVMGGMKNCNVL